MPKNVFFKTFSERVFVVINSCCWTPQNEIFGYSNGFIDERNESSKYFAFCIFHRPESHFEHS